MYPDSGEPLFIDLDHKGVQSTKNKTEPPYMGQLQNFKRVLFLGSLGQK